MEKEAMQQDITKVKKQLASLQTDFKLVSDAKEALENKIE